MGLKLRQLKLGTAGLDFLPVQVKPMELRMLILLDMSFYHDVRD